MPGVAEVLVVLRVAGEGEGVVPSDRVADDLDQRVHVRVVELPVQARLRVRLTHERVGHRRIEAALDPVLEPLPVEGEEVGALLPLDVDDLDVFAGRDLVCLRGRLVDADVEPRLREGGRKLDLPVGPGHRPSHFDDEIRRRWGAIQDATRGGRDDCGHLSPRQERLRTSRRRPLLEQPNCARVVRLEPRERERAEDAVAVTREAAKDGRRSVCLRSERLGVVSSGRREDRELGDLSALGVDHREAILRQEGDRRDSPRPDHVRLEERVLGEEASGDARAARCRHYACLTGAFASSSSA
jgi:hypothetical protein